MTDRSLLGLGLFAFVLWAMAGRGPVAGSLDEDPQAGSAGPVTDRLGALDGPATRLLREYGGLGVTDAFPVCPSTSCPSIEIMLAILPDPTASAIDWGFDAYLEAVRRAFEARGYSADRFALALPPHDTATRLRPGAMLFRRGAAPSDLVVLHVVWELPTTGIDMAAIATALDEREALLSQFETLKWELPDIDVVRIIGPTFSGSIPSLARAIEKWVAPRMEGQASCKHAGGHLPVFDIVTGSATGTGNRAQIDSLSARLAAADARTRNRRTVNGEPAGVDAKREMARYRATVRDDSTLFAALLSFMNLDSGQVAILRESGTAYSRAFVGSAAGVLDLPFPMNLAGVRAEHDHETENVEGANARGLLFPQPPRVSLTLKDPQKRRDQPNTTSHLTAPSQELVLEEIIATLQARDIRAVGIIATDVRDKLFLGQMLRRRLRNVQLFTTESNALFLRSPIDRSLRGMLVASTYPLILESERWLGRKGPAPPAFASEGAAGFYNATLLQLHGDSATTQFTGGLRADSGGLTVPYWITAVGDRSFVPLRYMTAMADTLAGSEQRGRSSLLVVLLLVGTAWMVGFFFWREAWPRKKTEEAPIGSMPPDLHTLDVHEQLYGLIGVAALGGAFLPVVIVLSGGDVAIRSMFDILAYATIFVWIVTMGVIVYKLGRSAVEWLRARSGSSAVATSRAPRAAVLMRVVMFFGGIAYLGTTFVYCVRILQLGPTEHTLLRHRALQLDSSLSPVVPLALIGLFFLTWACWHKWRVERLREVGALELMAENATDDSDTFLERVRSVRAALRDFAPRLSVSGGDLRIVPIGLATVILIVWLSMAFAGTLESSTSQSTGRAFNALLLGGILASLVILSWNTWRFCVIWKTMHEAFIEVAVSPLRPVLKQVVDRVRKGVRSGVINDQTRRAFESEATRIEQSLATLSQPTRTVSPDAKTGPEPYRDNWNAFSTLYAHAMRPPPQDREAAEKEGRKLDSREVLVSELVSLRIAQYAERARRYLFGLAALLLLGILVVNVLLASYWFVTQPTLRLVFMVVTVVTIVSILVVLTEVNRDTILSAVAGTDAGVVNWNPRFVMNVVLFGLVPILAMLSAELPTVRNVLFSWLEPMLRSATGG